MQLLPRERAGGHHKEVKFSNVSLAIPGAVIHRVGLMAAKPGDISDPGLVFVIPELIRPVTMRPMKPGQNDQSFRR